MKVIFINPFYAGNITIFNIPPLGLMYLASYIREKGYPDIKIYDTEALRPTKEQIKQYFLKEKPDVVAISIQTATINVSANIAKIAKEVNKNVIVIAGGPHPTAMPKHTLSYDSIDFVVFGEGEVTLLKLLDELKKSKKNKKKQNFSKINGLAYKKGSKVKINKRRELIKNIDELPFPAKDLLDEKLYEMAYTKRATSKKSTSLLTGRGCPFDCKFCTSKLIWGRGARMRSIPNILKEIEEDYSRGVREFYIADDTFTLNPERVIEFCKELIKNKYKIYWSVQSRVDILANHPRVQEMLYLMKKTGCNNIALGIESGNPEILKDINKMITLDQVRKAVKRINKARIKVNAGFIIGHLKDTPKTIKQTIDFAKSLDLDIAAFGIHVPYPGTDTYKEALKKGYLRRNVPWENFSAISKREPVLNLPNLSPKDLAIWQRRAIREFYFRPKYIIKKLLRIRSFVDIKNLYQGAQKLLQLGERKQKIIRKI